MIRIPFWKLQSIGNDFPLFHEADAESAVSFVNAEWEEFAHQNATATIPRSKHLTVDSFLAELAIQASDRRIGVGGDGILVLARLGEAELRMRMFNPDGTEDFCGNGLRIGAWHAYQQGWVPSKFEIHHLHRTVPCEVTADGRVLTTLGHADYSPLQVPHTAPAELFETEIVPGINGSSLTTGSTHTVLWVPILPDERTFLDVSQALEHDPRFPDRTSVIWATEQGLGNIQIRIWERGVGETQGCGTGSSAAAIDYLRRHGHAIESVTVSNPGGSVTIHAASWDAPLTIEGRAEEVYKGEFFAKLID